MAYVKLLAVLAVVVLAVIAAYSLAGIILAFILFALVIGVVSGLCEQITDHIKKKFGKVAQPGEQSLHK